MPEWSNGAVSKTVVPSNRDRGFESPSLRPGRQRAEAIQPFVVYRPVASHACMGERTDCKLIKFSVS